MAEDVGRRAFCPKCSDVAMVAAARDYKASATARILAAAAASASSAADADVAFVSCCAALLSVFWPVAESFHPATAVAAAALSLAGGIRPASMSGCVRTPSIHCWPPPAFSCCCNAPSNDRWIVGSPNVTDIVATFACRRILGSHCFWG